MSRGEKRRDLAVAGEDREWHWAEARLEGQNRRGLTTDVSKPAAVRYAWQSNPLATVFNGARLPAAPFRSDDWELKRP
jgi:sialate O-acetylesterase